MLDLTAPLDPYAISECKRVYALLPEVPAGGAIDHAYDHWTAFDYTTTFPDYNLTIARGPGSDRFLAYYTHSVSDNALGTNMASHTYRRNTHAVGIAVACLKGGSPSSFGLFPLLPDELEVLCAVNGAVAAKYGLDLEGVDSEGNPFLQTHAESSIHTASVDGLVSYSNYFLGNVDLPVDNPRRADPDCRWDLGLFTPSSGPLTEAIAIAHGDLIRQRSRQFKLIAK